jgi:thioredoxin reductase (NADPH)
MNEFDAVVVGGGPAGLGAAIHLAFHHRRVLVVDRRSGPLPYTLTPLYNVPGFAAQRGVDILRSLEAQARHAGAHLERGNVVKVQGGAGAFTLTLEDGRLYRAQTLLLATGVARHHPLVNGDYAPWLKYAAKGNTYYCPDCEGPELLGKDIVVIGVGGANAAISVSKPLLEFARRVRVLLTGGMDLKPEWEQLRADLGLEVLRGHIHAVEGERGIVSALVLQDGTRVVADGYYVDSPKLPRNDLAKQLGLALGPRGHILTGPRGQARMEGGAADAYVEGVWAAGDVQPQTQQIAIALGCGNIAAVMIDQHLQHRQPRRLGQGSDAAASSSHAGHSRG